MYVDWVRLIRSAVNYSNIMTSSNIYTAMKAGPLVDDNNILADARVNIKAPILKRITLGRCKNKIVASRQIIQFKALNVRKGVASA